MKICCPEEIAWRMEYINAGQLQALADSIGNSSYGIYLKSILNER